MANVTTAAMSMMTTEFQDLGVCPKTYFCSEGLILPLFNESDIPRAVRGFLYLLGLLWCFLGVAIIADIFMCAIEKITSKTRVVKIANQESPKGFDEIEVKVWNDTVANLTLMALGSSAPEILLSCIEIVGNNFESGALGPSTIVGSAAFNLLVITGVCVLAIKSPDTRRIASFKVFAVTAFFCVFAYVWLVIILVFNTANVVDLWEAIITFLMFPILVILAYLAEKDFCMSKPPAEEDEGVELGFSEKHRLLTPSGAMNEKKMREFVRSLTKIHPHLSEEAVARLAAAKIQEEQPHDRMWYRINATRALGGANKLIPTMSEELQEVYDTVKAINPDAVEDQHHDFAGSTQDLSEGGNKAVVEFMAARCAVMENEGRVKIGLHRYGRMNSRVIFKIETIDGTAEANSDYVPMKDTLIFEPEETQKFIEIEIIDDNEWEPDEVFFVKLSLDSSDPSYNTSLMGRKAIMEVTIINDDEPGTFEFSKPSLLFKESAGKALIPVERLNGADGRISLKWKTDDMTAKAGQDYEAGDSELVFEQGETTKTIEIAIYDDQEFEKDECFKVTLTEATGGAKLGRITKTIVTIVNDDDFNGMVNRLVNLTNMNMDSLRVDRTTWAEQFRNAMNVNGGDLEGATNMDYIMHFLTFGWKILFALVPPPSIWGGWLSFVCALGMIAILTAVIGDLASIFGCLVGLKPSVTAITFVALGTSLPDLFASKTAATSEATADSSIGNVTGSNSVNVFLGLGLPWLIAAIYWKCQNKAFEVPAETLSFSVVVYSVCAVVCLLMLVVRRYTPLFGKAELGGTRIPQVITFVGFCSLWLIYILLSSLQAEGHIPNL